MLRFYIVLIGLIICVLQQLFHPFTTELQFIFFIVGIVLLGIPHGAADLLVAIQNAKHKQQKFSMFLFFRDYLARILIFGIILYFFTFIGILLFLLLAAYHFGETDLHFFHTDTLVGKLLVSSYGLVILSVIIFGNIQEVKELLLLSKSGLENSWVINIAGIYRYQLLSFSLVFFFSAVFIYFIRQVKSNSTPDLFLIQFSVLVFILYNLPLILGFTFYFVVWHSVFSLRNIVFYLKEDKNYSNRIIIKQISFYSLLALGGIFISGAAGYIFSNSQAVMIYVFLGLAVLTAPHMQIMHDMYHKIRLFEKR